MSRLAPRSRRLIVAALVAVVTAAIALTVPRAFAGAVAPYPFSNADFGFAEGSNTDGLAGRLDEMDTYLGDRKPIIRLDLNWWSVQECAACTPQFSHLDGIVDAAAARGIRVLIILGYAPPWAGGHDGDDKWFPATDQPWQEIVRATVAHFGAKVQAYEIWNEPNLAVFGRYGNAAIDDHVARRQRYWELVKLAHPLVKAGCPQCTVVAGGSANGDNTGAAVNNNESAQWLDWAYQKGFGPFFDAVALHPYPDTPAANPQCTRRWWNMLGPPDPKCGELAAVRAVMVSRGDSAKKIWGTEFGVSSVDARTQAARDPRVVRDTLEEGIRLWKGLDYTGPLFVFSYRDDPRCNGSANVSECRFGLTDTEGRPKQPAYDDVASAIAGRLPAELPPGRALHRVSGMSSPNGLYRLWMQPDGNLVLYRNTTFVWGTKTYYPQVKPVTDIPVRLVNQTDGNLVLYNAGNTRAPWATGTWVKGKCVGGSLPAPASGALPGCTLRLRDDGILELYNTAGKRVWDHKNGLAK